MISFLLHDAFYLGPSYQVPQQKQLNPSHLGLLEITWQMLSHLYRKSPNTGFEMPRPLEPRLLRMTWPRWCTRIYNRLRDTNQRKVMVEYLTRRERHIDTIGLSLAT